ncbi:hypothetical protein [Nonomuraea guangzhouensis]|uniref:Uncharacterized protein n=1 Tax=Nonomuraea guangzhouensis TaxID=1291555 RepID=A0ABW4GVY3_9ACTN|nr:hypothetical protein [Nonomuraea guangzhouensis]
MSNLYPVTDQAPLRRLTESGIDRYRTLNYRDEKELEDLRATRAELTAEIASIDDVMADLNETIGRRQAKMRGDLISLLPPGREVPLLPGSQGDPDELAATFGGLGSAVIEPTQILGAASFPETNPDGYCIHCNQPAWRVSTTPASPKGARHSYGATCNPDDPASGVAELDEQAES